MSEATVLARDAYAAINNRDLAALERIFAPDIIRHARNEVGIGPALRAVEAAFAATPELRFVVEDCFGAGDRAAVRVSVHGTSAETPPMILEIFRCSDGRVAEIWGAGTSRA